MVKLEVHIHVCLIHVPTFKQATNSVTISEAANSYGAWAPDSYTDLSRPDPRPSLFSERSLPYLPATHGTFPLSSFGAPRRTRSGTIPGGSGGLETVDFPLTYSPGSVSEISSDARPDDEGDEDLSANQKGMKRGRGSDGAEENPRKSRNPRKTAVACNFCRGELTMGGIFVYVVRSTPFPQAGSSAAMAPSRHAITAPCGCSNASTSQFNGVGALEKPQKDQSQRKEPAPNPRLLSPRVTVHQV